MGACESQLPLFAELVSTSLTPQIALCDPTRVRARPFIKWVGGKNRLLARLAPLLPPNVGSRRYFEPFAGGGALFFSRPWRSAVLADVNASLVRTYRAVRDSVETVIAMLEGFERLHDADLYYRTRQRFNEGLSDDSELAATFIYLNRTCFNGLYRENRKGEFNVPVGAYERPKILDANCLRTASEALRGAELRAGDFDAWVDEVGAGDFVYCDPPYVPASETARFSQYARGGFSPADQERLRDAFVAMAARGAYVMLSNSDTPKVRELYRGWPMVRLLAPRSVSCRGGSRRPIGELVIRSYGVGELAF